jgi:hypothetical protein
MKSDLLRNAILLILVIVGALPFTASASSVYCGTTLCGDLTNADGTISADDSQVDVGNVGGTNTNGNVSGSISYFPSANLNINSTSTADSTDNTGASVIVYYFTIGSSTAQSSPASVPIKISGSYQLSSEVTPFASANASVSLSAFGIAGMTDDLTSCTSQSCAKASNFVLTGTVTAGSVVELYMVGSVTTQANPYYPTSNASAEASLDPVIQIDPTFADASNYTVLLSPAIGNSPVPLPASGWLILCGLGGLAAMARSRGRRAGVGAR